ncbi:MAG: response regulator transcription factor [Burkholderiales bacterium]|nr:response regulator transcription factor [Burkholderiales bacterium]
MHALVVEDEAPMRQALCGALARWGFTVCCESRGGPALACWQAQPPDVLLLDLGLPDMDGLDVLQRGRALGLRTPVLLLTARATLGDRILGLNFGADDYLAKPFDLGELEARLRALLRRNQPPLPQRGRTLAALSWDAGARAFSCGGEPLSLSPREKALLRALLERPNQAVPKEGLVQTVFPRGHVLEDAVEVVAHRLRKKLTRCGVAIVTLRGLGYLIKAAG